MSDTSFVYFFTEHAGGLKIGKTNNLYSRFMQLGGAKRFSTDGLYLEFENEREALFFEKLIHRFFKSQRDLQAQGKGHTECYQASARSLLILHLVSPERFHLNLMSIDSWVDEGRLIDSIGLLAGVWLRSSHKAKPWRCINDDCRTPT